MKQPPHEEYNITPVQVRRKNSTVTTPPHTPTCIDQSQVKIHRLPPPIPLQDEPLVIMKPQPTQNPCKRVTKVKFAVEGSPDPPPIPPRSTDCTPTSPTSRTLTIVLPEAVPISYPVPISPPPPMTPPPLSPAHK